MTTQTLLLYLLIVGCEVAFWLVLLPTTAHGLAAVYVGFTVAFGSVAVRWADAHFAYRLGSGPAPAYAPKGWKAVRFDFELWLRRIAAWIIAFALIEALIAFVGNEAVTLRSGYARKSGGEWRRNSASVVNYFRQNEHPRWDDRPMAAIHASRLARALGETITYSSRRPVASRSRS